MAQVGQSKGFAPKEPPKLNPPQSTPISVPHLANCDGTVPKSSVQHAQYFLINGIILAQASAHHIQPT